MKRLLAAVFIISLLGLRSYGARFADKQRGCTDTQVVHPVGLSRSGSGKAALAQFRPTEQTPIGYSCEGRGGPPPTGQRTIAFVSAGKVT
ncbi:MAG: hypothetical protein ABJA34_01630 [Pseudonocardiales bacterium]